MVRRIRAFASDTGGATSIEYGAIAVLISVVVLVALSSISGSVQEAYDLIAGAFE
jgi:Flp pilus assembly pilin Flp